MTRLQTAIDRIKFSRGYTLKLLDHVEPADWFRMPTPAVTHIAWQVGHLAMAEYRLALDRVRGEFATDAELISPQFLKRFAKDSIPEPESSNYPTPHDIRGVLDRVHELTMRELAELPESEWDAPPLKPHPLFQTKIGSLFWCAHHEMLHAGQIGLVRRLLGQKPIW